MSSAVCIGARLHLYEGPLDQALESPKHLATPAAGMMVVDLSVNGSVGRLTIKKEQEMDLFKPK